MILDLKLDVLNIDVCAETVPDGSFLNALFGKGKTK
jgi:hypothetical protein